MSHQFSSSTSSGTYLQKTGMKFARHPSNNVAVIDAKSKQIISKGNSTSETERFRDHRPKSVAGVISINIPKLYKTSGVASNYEDVYCHVQDYRLDIYKSQRQYTKNGTPLHTYSMIGARCTPLRNGRNQLHSLEIISSDFPCLIIRSKSMNLERLLNAIVVREEQQLFKQPSAATEKSGCLSTRSSKPTVYPIPSKAISEETIPWRAEKEQTIIARCQELLSSSGMRVTNLSNDWMDGRALQALVSALRPDLNIFSDELGIEETILRALEVATGAFGLQEKPYLLKHFREGDSNAIYLFLVNLFDAKEMREMLTWCQMLTSSYDNIFVENFGSSWRDGRALMAFMHALLPVFIDLDRKPTDDVIYELIGIAVEAFDLKPGSLSCYHFKQGMEESIFGFVQQIYNHLRAEGKLEKIEPRTVVAAEPMMEQDANQVTELEKPVLLWCKKQTDGYENVNIGNFTSCWKDGLALNALIHSLRPEYIAKDDLLKQESGKRIRYALDLVSQVFGIETTIEPYQMENGEKEAIYPLVYSLYKHYTRIYEAPKPVDQEVGGLKLNRENGLDPQVEGCQENKPSKGIIDEVDKVEQHCGKATRENISKDEEDELTMALIRTCHRCKIYFCKDGGCNNMQCICGATQCYICRQPNVEYNHFCSHELDPHTRNCQEDCGRKCLLNFDQDEFDESEKNKVKAKSRKSSNDQDQYTTM